METASLPLAEANAAMPYTRTLGLEFTSVTADEVRARVDWVPERCTTGGAMHGGVLMAAADSVGAMVAFLNLPDGATGTSTVSSATNFLRGVRDRYVEAVGRPLHKGRTTIVVETDLVDADDRLVARVTQTQAVLR
jgi:uncharacterized protein (TIGR00369 family)